MLKVSFLKLSKRTLALKNIRISDLENMTLGRYILIG